MKHPAKNARFMLPPRGFFIFFVLLAVLVGTSLTKTASFSDTKILLKTSPSGIMGTECTLMVYVDKTDAEYGNQLLKDAENVLRACEILASTWMENSEVSRFNRAAAGERVALSPFTEAFFLRSRKAWEETSGIFDVTCGGVWQLWREAEKKGREPSEEEILAAKEDSRWEFIRLKPGFAEKMKDSVQVVTGGIAKGMAIDLAMKSLRKERVYAAVVDVGGDISIFRKRGMSVPITVMARNPDGTSRFENLSPEDVLGEREIGGVCTSGNYARFFYVGGKRYGQTINPRTGRPTEEILSVTVAAPDAETADVWATVLMVLGEKGRKMLPAEVKVLKMVRRL